MEDDILRFFIESTDCERREWKARIQERSTYELKGLLDDWFLEKLRAFHIMSIWDYLYYPARSRSWQYCIGEEENMREFLDKLTNQGEEVFLGLSIFNKPHWVMLGDYRSLLKNEPIYERYRKLGTCANDGYSWVPIFSTWVRYDSHDLSDKVYWGIKRSLERLLQDLSKKPENYNEYLNDIKIKCQNLLKHKNKEQRKTNP